MKEYAPIFAVVLGDDFARALVAENEFAVAGVVRD